MSIAVPCPKCGSILKAPEGMAGRKARCKKCQEGFRIPGERPADQVDSVGDSQHLSVISESPFAFDGSPAASPPPPPAPTPTKSTPTKSTSAKPAAEAPPSDNPFAIPSEASPAEEEPPVSKTRQKPAKQSKTAIADSPSKSSYRTKAVAKSSGGKGRMVAFLLGGLVCAGGGAAGLYGFLEYQKNQHANTNVAANAPVPPSVPAPVEKPQEKAKAEVTPTKPNALAKKDAAVSAATPEANPTAEPEKPAAKGRTPNVRVSGGIKIPPLGQKTAPFEKAQHVVSLPHAAVDTKQILVGGDDGAVVAVLRRTDIGLGGKGVVDTLDVYALTTQKLRDSTAIPGDDIKTFPRMCDLSPGGDRFACEYPVGKLSVFQLGTETRLLDGLDLNEKPTDKHPGIAAMFFLADDRVAILTKVGSVEVYDVGTKKRISRTEPLPSASNWVPRRTVVLHRDRDPDKCKLFAYSNEAIYEIPVTGKPKLALSLPKKPTECHALGVDAGGNRVAVAYKASDPGVHVRLVHGRTGETKLGADDVIDITDMGTPTAIEWNRPETFSLLTEKGIGFAYDADANRVIVGLRPASLKVQQYQDRSHHWCLLPDKTDPKKSHLVNIHTPPESYSSLQIDGKWTPYSVGVTLDGTVK